MKLAIERPGLMNRIKRGIEDYSITMLLGPRQCGKTTLARELVKEADGILFDLEDPETPLREEAAKTVLKDLKGLVVIDEIQRQPSLFPLLRVLADRSPSPCRFLILGSASAQIAKSASESLAGRVAIIEMGGFTLDEIDSEDWNQLWIRGAFPRSYLGRDDRSSGEWRRNFVQTFLERDLPQLGIRVPAPTLRRFWTMLAHHQNQIYEQQTLANALGVSSKTIRHYLDILEGAYMLRQLPPWWTNVKKLLVKRPKVALRDTGLLHTLLGIESRQQALSHPILGHSWESFAQEQVIRMLQAERDAFFYKLHSGAEMDLLITIGGKRYGFEFKFGDTPKVTRSMRVCLEDLQLERIFLIYPGDNGYALDPKIEAVPISRLPEALRLIGQ